MESGGSPKSLLEWLKTVPDPRSRHGRSYPRWGLLATLILGALQGEGSLQLVGIMAEWMSSWAAVGGVNTDGKVLRGSARASERQTALEAGQELQVVLGKGRGSRGAVKLIQSLPCRGKWSLGIRPAPAGVGGCGMGARRGLDGADQRQ